MMSLKKARFIPAKKATVKPRIFLGIRIDTDDLHFTTVWNALSSYTSGMMSRLHTDRICKLGSKVIMRSILDNRRTSEKGIPHILVSKTAQTK